MTALTLWAMPVRRLVWVWLAVLIRGPPPDENSAYVVHKSDALLAQSMARLQVASRLTLINCFYGSFFDLKALK